MNNYEKTPAYSKSAFYHESGGIDGPQEGLNLLEYFTGQALIGYTTSFYDRSPEMIAQNAINAAKETLKLLKKEYE